MQKEPLTLLLDAELLAQAQTLGLDLAKELEGRVLQAVRWAKWQEENREAIDAHNKRIEEQGLWSDGLRLFR